MQCRLTLKNFAWNQHWFLVVALGGMKEIYDMMVPVTFAYAFFGESLGLPRARQRFYFYILPISTCIFILFWHACLGQPGVLRYTVLGSVWFYAGQAACFIEVSHRLRIMVPDSNLSVNWLFFVFVFGIAFPTWIYGYCVIPLSFGRQVSGVRRLAIRLVVHPLVCEFALAVLRNFSRQMVNARSGMTVMLFVARPPAPPRLAPPSFHVADDRAPRLRTSSKPCSGGS